MFPIMVPNRSGAVSVAWPFSVIDVNYPPLNDFLIYLRFQLSRFLTEIISVNRNYKFCHIGE